MTLSTKAIICILIAVVAAMFAFSFAMSPLYSAYCKITGLSTAERDTSSASSSNREITVQFATTNNASIPWDFYPKQTSIHVHPGAIFKVFFYAKNNANHKMTVQAIPSFAPVEAVRYFKKIECFCFTQQTLKPGDDMFMPLVFKIDNKVPEEMNTITLAYTLFDTTKKEG